MKLTKEVSLATKHLLTDDLGRVPLLDQKGGSSLMFTFVVMVVAVVSAAASRGEGGA